jgi:hypothetical protein
LGNPNFSIIFRVDQGAPRVLNDQPGAVSWVHNFVLNGDRLALPRGDEGR